MMNEIDNTDDLIDIRTVIARFEDLEQELESSYESDADEDKPELAQWIAGLAHEGNDTAEEYQRLLALLEECKGNGGDEQWRGDWYPVTLIRDSYFKEYAQDLADEIGAVDANAGWPMSCIDWDQAARELRMDYTAVEFDGETYWTR